MKTRFPMAFLPAATCGFLPPGKRLGIAASFYAVLDGRYPVIGFVLSSTLSDRDAVKFFVAATAHPKCCIAEKGHALSHRSMQKKSRPKPGESGGIGGAPEEI
jgi:hypothetical protein